MEIRILKHYKKRSRDVIIQENVEEYYEGWKKLLIRNDFIKIDIYLHRAQQDKDSQSENLYDVLFTGPSDFEQYLIDKALSLSKECFETICKIDNKFKVCPPIPSGYFMRWVDYYYKNVTVNELYDIWIALKEL